MDPPLEDTLREQDWDTLLTRIKNETCTPFLGAGACAGVLPLGSEVAQDWAKRYAYPLGDNSDLVRVAQFLSIKRDRLFPKELMVALLNGKTQFQALGSLPHDTLAGLPFPVIMTTNYDDLMVQALKRAKKEPQREICRWTEAIIGFRKGITGPVNVANPLVFHLHGHSSVVQSLVLTEDDYLDFLTSMIAKRALLPKPIQESMRLSTFLFIGYRLADLNFRVLLQSLRPEKNLTLHVAVLYPLGYEAQAYMDDYFGSSGISV